MKNTTKKIASLFFILLAFTPFLIMLSFDVQKKATWNRMQEKLQQDDLHTIVIPINEVVWMDKHEILVNDCMFDIHHFSLQDGMYIFTGLYDEEETEIIKYGNKTTEKNKEQNQFILQILKWLQSTIDDIKEEAIVFSCVLIKLSSFKTSLINLFPEIPTPPPRSY